MIAIRDFLQEFPLTEHTGVLPWIATENLTIILKQMITTLDPSYQIDDGIAIHRSAIVESGVVLKPPIVIGPDCFVAAHAYLRNGVCLGESVTVGPGCEVKSSVIASHSSLAHFNFVGNSIVGSHVNMEAGAILTNYHNDRSDKRIFAVYESMRVDTGVKKFGALIGDRSKIGANAVLAPGTILPPDSVVKRLEHVDQSRE